MKKFLMVFLMLTGCYTIKGPEELRLEIFRSKRPVVVETKTNPIHCVVSVGDQKSCIEGILEDFPTDTSRETACLVLGYKQFGQIPNVFVSDKECKLRGDMVSAGTTSDGYDLFQAAPTPPITQSSAPESIGEQR